MGSLILGQAAAVGAARGDSHETVSNLLRTRLEFGKFVRPGPLWWGFDWEDAKRQAGRSGSPVPALDGGADPRNGWVVLIDEIDKAEADLPNGLLQGAGPVTLRPWGSTNRSRSQASSPWSSSPPTRRRVLPDAFIANAAWSCT